MRKMSAALIGCVCLFLALGGTAFAHVKVYPGETMQGAYEKFTVRVPSEKDGNTVKVELKIPEDVDVSRVEPKDGWKYELVKDENGKITAIVWTAVGRGLSVTEFAEFNIQGKVSSTAGKLVWKAIQTYSDHSTVEWAGAEDSDTPASVTMVRTKSDAAARENSNKAPLAVSLSLIFSLVA
ncbi:MAG TPA: YcnI family protein, partial [Bacilli bacterium]